MPDTKALPTTVADTYKYIEPSAPQHGDLDF